jgi:HlyD family secretion protein
MPDIIVDPSISRRRRIKRYAWASIGAAVFISLVAWAVGRTTVGPAISRSDVWIASVKRGPLPIVISGAGTFEPTRQRWITAGIPGVVESVKVQAGDSVTADTVVAVLANPALETALVQAQANVASTEAARAALRAQFTGQLLNMEGSLANAQAKAKTETLKEQAERPLLDLHYVSTLAYSTDRLQAEEDAHLVELLRHGIATYQQSMAEQDRAATAQLAALRFVLDSSRQSMNSLSVVAGIDGVVQDVEIHAGQTLAVGGNIARVASLKDLKVALEVAASESGEVVVGQSVTLGVTTNVARNLTGRVIRVSPAVVNGSVSVDVVPESELPSDIRPNLAVTGEIHIASIPETDYLQRPANADPGSHMKLYQLVNDGHEAVPVSVRFGAASDRSIQIISGLKPGDQVIISDTSSFAGSERVKVQ